MTAYLTATAYLIDTNIISEFIKPVPTVAVVRWLQSLDPQSLYASVITLGEIRLGIEKLPPGKRRDELERWIQTGLPNWFAENLLPVDRSIADTWGRISAQARRQGLALTTSDGLLAATALNHDLTLATRNTRDFAGLECKLFNPWNVERATDRL